MLADASIPDYDTIWLARAVVPGFQPSDRAAAAMLTRAGRVVALGSRRQVERWKRSGARTVDARDALISPGLIDSHTHLLYWALNERLVVDLRDVRAPRELAIAFRSRRGARPGDHAAWLVGARLSAQVFGGRFPTAAELDAVVADQPLYIRSRDGHTVCLNSAGVRAAGITRRSVAPAGGRVEMDERGLPTGVLFERATDLAPDPIQAIALRADAASRALVNEALDKACARLRGLGFVGVHTMDGPESLRALQRRVANPPDARGRIRVTHAIPLAGLEQAERLGLVAGLGNEWLRLGAVKIFADGALGSRTALMFDSYPGTDDDYGQAVVAGAALIEAVTRAAAAGWPVWIHAIGDRAVSDALDAIAAARRIEAARLPHRIEHAQCVRWRDIGRMARLGVIASMQPCHLPGDIAAADAAWPRARRNAYPFRAMLDRGVALAFGSDMPIEAPDLWRGLWGAAARSPWGAADPAAGWFPGQRLTVREALDAYTRGAALSVGDRDRGVLRPGAWADVTIWPSDPRGCRPQQMAGLAPRGSAVGGYDVGWRQQGWLEGL